jgi:hypothetical protein
MRRSLLTVCPENRLASADTATSMGRAYRCVATIHECRALLKAGETTTPLDPAASERMVQLVHVKPRNRRRTRPAPTECASQGMMPLTPVFTVLFMIPTTSIMGGT